MKGGNLMFGGLEFALIPVIVWMYLKVRQGKVINNAVKALEESGQIYFGQDAGAKPKIMVLAAVNKKGEIVDAQLVRLLKWFKPANAFDFPEIVGKKMEDLAPSKITRDIEILDALKNLKQNYNNMKGDKEEKKTRIRVKTKRAIKR